MDSIQIKNIRLSACHGVLDFEKTTPQDFEFDVSIGLPLQKAGQSDKLAHTVNYAELYALIARIVTQNTYNLIESLGEVLCENILHFSPLIQTVTLSIRKLKPPMEGTFDYVGITITRP